MFAKSIVPELVIVPPFRPIPAVIEVTVPPPAAVPQVTLPAPSVTKAWPIVPSIIGRVNAPLPIVNSSTDKFMYFLVVLIGISVLAYLIYLSRIKADSLKGLIDLS